MHVDRNLSNQFETQAEKRRLKQNLTSHVKFLSGEIGERNLYNYENLEKAYQYIKAALDASGLAVTIQNYRCQGKLVRNIIAEISGSVHKEKIIVVGAHYDTVLGSPGADDNASGIAALLELARLFEDIKSKHTIRFAAFTLEEPPVFGSPEMGSRRYAAKLRENDENVIGMICLEMIGYYSHKKGGQQYPLSLIKHGYPNVGNFIAVVGDFMSEHLVKQIKDGLETYCKVPSYALATYRSVPGVELSDHSSFWAYNYPAIMLTDTAFYRNPYYHEKNDVYDTLNYRMFSELVEGLFHTIKWIDRIGIHHD